MNSPIYEKIEESLGEILSQYIWEFNTPEMREKIKYQLNDFLNDTYETENELYVTKVWCDELDRIQVELNPNGIIKTRNQKIDSILNDDKVIIEQTITISKNNI